MKLDAQIYRRRAAQFGEAIEQLGFTNVVIRHCIELYARGDILTKEEAMQRMIVMLAENWTELNEKALKLQMSLCLPSIIPPRF